MNPAFLEWLKNPRIKVELVDSVEMRELQERVSLAEQEAKRASLLYARECDLNARLIDLLKLHGIKWR